jgi:hypothetical protein
LLNGISPQVLKERHDKMLAIAKETTLPGLAAVLADHGADEYSENLQEIVRAIEATLAEGYDRLAGGS